MNWCLSKSAFFCLLLLGTGVCLAGSLGVTAIALENRPADSQFSAQLAVDLGADVEEALIAGVPIVLSWSLKVRESRVWAPDPTLWATDGELRLSHHSLSRYYRLVDSLTGSERSFPSLNDLIKAVADIAWPLPPLGPVIADRADTVLTFRIWLNIGELPPPLRLPKYLDAAWRLDSGLVVQPLGDAPPEIRWDHPDRGDAR